MQGGRQQVSSATWAGQMKRGPRCLLHHPYNQGWKLHQQKDNNQWGVVRECVCVCVCVCVCECVWGPMIKEMKESDLFFTLWLDLCVRACMCVEQKQASCLISICLTRPDQYSEIRLSGVCVCVWVCLLNRSVKNKLYLSRGRCPMVQLARLQVGFVCFFQGLPHIFTSVFHIFSCCSVIRCCAGYQSRQRGGENHLKMYSGKVAWEANV